LSDEKHAVIEAYGAWHPLKMPLFGTVRTTFLINPEGQIAKRYDNVDPKGHSAQLLADFEALSA
jgi:peroxiredoxin Q/BCP